MSQPKLSIRNVSRRFDDGEKVVQALENVSLDVPAGQFLMLCGPSGCGKTTLLSMLAGLDKPDSGELLLDGKPIKGPGPERSLVFQDGALFPWLTVLKNVEFGLKQAGVPAKERTERARHFLNKVGLSKFEKHAIHELSGGMRQRVAIARSLVLEPQVLLMDEPFSALDAITREDLYVELQELWADREITVVFVTHNTREAVTLGDRVILMSPRPGRIQEEFEIEILRPRHIEDIDVAARAQGISHAMKEGRRSAPEELLNDERHQANRILRDPARALGRGG